MDARVFVARGLPMPHCLDGQRVGQGSRRVQLEPIIEDEQTDAGVFQRVVAVDDRIDDRFEHGSRAELRGFHPSGVLARGDPRVQLDEVHCVTNLPVERAGDRRRVVLIRLTENDAAVPHRLYECAAHIFFRVLGAQQYAGDGGSCNIVLVQPDQTELLDLHIIWIGSA